MKRNNFIDYIKSNKQIRRFVMILIAFIGIGVYAWIDGGLEGLILLLFYIAVVAIFVIASFRQYKKKNQ